LLEEKVDPLSDVVFVDGVVFRTMLQDAVDQLADSGYRIFLSQFIIDDQFSCEGVGKAVNKKIYQSCFAHDLLTLSVWVSFTREWVLVNRVFNSKDEPYYFYE
jgi:hypothetical protein